MEHDNEVIDSFRAIFVFFQGVGRISETVTAEHIQAIARELQVVLNQLQSVSSQISEFEVTIKALSDQNAERPVFRSYGNILLEVEDRDALSSEIADSKLSLENHLARLTEREEALRSQYERMTRDFEKE